MTGEWIIRCFCDVFWEAVAVAPMPIFLTMLRSQSKCSENFHLLLLIPSTWLQQSLITRQLWLSSSCEHVHESDGWRLMAIRMFHWILSRRKMIHNEIGPCKIEGPSKRHFNTKSRVTSEYVFRRNIIGSKYSSISNFSKRNLYKYFKYSLSSEKSKHHANAQNNKDE